MNGLRIRRDSRAYLCEDTAAMESIDQPPPAVRSRQWIGRAAFEAALIVMGLIGAFLLDDWRDRRERHARVEAALSSIRAELEANRTAVAAAIVNHEDVIGKLRQAAESDAPYQGGLISNPGFSAVAWEATRNGAVTNDIDHVTLITLGRAYTALADYIADRRVFVNHLYTNDTAELRRKPLGLAGWLSDITRHAKGTQERIAAALQALAARQPRADHRSTRAGDPAFVAPR